MPSGSHPLRSDRHRQLVIVAVIRARRGARRAYALLSNLVDGSAIAACCGGYASAPSRRFWAWQSMIRVGLFAEDGALCSTG